MRLTNGHVLLMGVLAISLFVWKGLDNTNTYNDHVMQTTTHQE